MKRTTAQKLTYAFGISMAFLMGITLVLPAIAPDASTPHNQQQQPDPTDPPPPPTLPPPVTDFSTIAYEEDYLHPSGLFAVGVPTGWFAGPPVISSSNATATMNNPTISSVIEVSVQEPGPAIESDEQLGALFTTATLATSWRNYAQWNELTRRFEDGRLVIDYAAQDNARVSYIAQDSIWYDENWVYRTRVVVPANMNELLTHMIDTIGDQVKPNLQFAGTPVGWQGFFDTIDQHILRYPSTWSLTDSLPGQPTSLESQDGVQVRVQTIENAASDADRATEIVQSFRSGIEVVSVEETSRTGGEGFSVAYQYTDPDGEQFSGLAVLLNGSEDTLHVADALIDESGIDLNSEDALVSYNDLIQSFETFSLITELNLESAS